MAPQAGLAIGKPEVVGGQRIAGMQGQGLLKLFDRSGEIILAIVVKRQQVVYGQGIFFDLETGAQLFDRGSVAALLAISDRFRD